MYVISNNKKFTRKTKLVLFGIFALVIAPLTISLRASTELNINEPSKILQEVEKIKIKLEIFPKTGKKGWSYIKIIFINFDPIKMSFRSGVIKQLPTIPFSDKSIETKIHSNEIKWSKEVTGFSTKRYNKISLENNKYSIHYLIKIDLKDGYIWKKDSPSEDEISQKNSFFWGFTMAGLIEKPRIIEKIKHSSPDLKKLINAFSIENYSLIKEGKVETFISTKNLTKEHPNYIKNKKITFKKIIKNINGIPTSIYIFSKYNELNLRDNENYKIKFKIAPNHKYTYFKDGKKIINRRNDEFITYGIPYKGITRPKFEIIEKEGPKTSTSMDGTVKLKITNYNSETIKRMNINVEPNSLQLKHDDTNLNIWHVTKLKSGQQFKIKASFKYNGDTWLDKSTEPIFSKNFRANWSTNKGIVIPKINHIKKYDKPPRLSNDMDGQSQIEFYKHGIVDEKLTWEQFNYLKRNVEIEIKTHKSIKVSWAWDDHTRGLKISELASEDQVRIEIKPKKDKYWENGKQNIEVMKSFKSPTSTHSDIDQPIIKDIVPFKLPINSNLSNGIIEIFLENFSNSKMKLESNGKRIVYNDATNSIKIFGVKSNEHVEFIIIPKSKFLWKNGNDIHGSFTMPKIIGFPDITSIKIWKINPKSIGGDGYITINPFKNPQEGAKLQHSINNGKTWKNSRESGHKMIGKNGFAAKFRWKLDDNYGWINYSPSAPTPEDITLENPTTVITPKINVILKKISSPKGIGSVDIVPFKLPKGATLEYKSSDNLGKWENVPPIGKIWKNKKDGFQIEFRWKLQDGFVWEQNQPLNIENSNIELKDPIDNSPPEWEYINNENDVSKITKINLSKYSVNVKNFYNEETLIENVDTWFNAKDNYGFTTREIVSNPKTGKVIFNNIPKTIILKASDLSGNTSRLIINLIFKNRIEDISNLIEGKIKFKKTFSGNGEISTIILPKNKDEIPFITFKDSSNKNIDISLKHIYAIYRVINERGNPINWRDKNGQHFNSWSSPDKKASNPFGSHYPTNLSNKQKIQIKFLPYEGYKLIISSIQPDVNHNESRIYEFVVTSLVQELVGPITEPNYIFAGSDGQGTVKIKKTIDNDPRINYLLQVFRPYSPESLPQNTAIVDKNGNPVFGIELYIPQNENMNNLDNWQLIAGIPNNFSEWNNLPQNIRILWEDTTLSSNFHKIWNSNIQKSFILPNKIIGLANFYSLRSIAQAKDGWGYKWENANTPQVDILDVKLYPQTYTNKISWKETSLYFGTQVKGLSIKPLIDISIDPFFLNFEPTKDNTYKYKGDLIITPSYIPNRKKGDKYVWRYKILDQNNNLISDWSNNIDIKRIENSDSNSDNIEILDQN